MTTALAIMSDAVSSVAFQQYEALLIRLADAMRAGDRERANVIRREMEAPERELDDAMLDRLDGLSADLYMLDGKELPERDGAVQVTPEHLIDDLKEAWDGQDWESVLRLLRRNVSSVPQEHRAYLRAVAYERLGQTRSALAFIDYAAEQNPEDVTYRYFGLEYLEQLSEDVEASRRANAYIESESTPPVLRVRSAVTLTRAAQRPDTANSSEALKDAALVLARTLSNKGGWDDAPRGAIALAYIALGICLEALGDAMEGAKAYRLARQVDPKGVPSQQQLDTHLAGRRRNSRSVDIRVPDEAAEAHPTTASFQTLKAQQIWLAAA